MQFQLFRSSTEDKEFKVHLSGLGSFQLGHMSSAGWPELLHMGRVPGSNEEQISMPKVPASNTF